MTAPTASRSVASTRTTLSRVVSYAAMPLKDQRGVAAPVNAETLSPQMPEAHPVPPQTPLEHTSALVQALPSSQIVPSGSDGLEQPVVGLQVPAAWHESTAVQGTGSAPTHAPPWQRSVRVHALPSSQGAP